MPYFRKSAKTVLISLSVVLVSTVCRAEQTLEENETSYEKTCLQYASINIPEADGPSQAEASSLMGCDAEALYYGIGSNPDPVKARKCAIVRFKEEDPTVMNRNVILATIYANGLGATRNYDLAIALMCKEGSHAPLERWERLKHLLDLKKKKSQRTDFHWCNDVTSGFMMGACQGQVRRLKEASLNLSLSEITMLFTPEQKAVYDRLKIASDNFISVRSQAEIDMSGTAGAMLSLRESTVLDADFLQMFRLLEKGKSPKYTKAQESQREAKLKKLMKIVIQHKGEAEFIGTITADSVLKTQSEWVKYREEWFRMVKIRYPQVSQTNFGAWLATKRYHMLSDLVGRLSSL